uniref:Magnesium transporter n=1 Tax=Blastobotrys adeninivorans TaxID=409370 RepID=A0A060SXS6_BLAAD
MNRLALKWCITPRISCRIVAGSVGRVPLIRPAKPLYLNPPGRLFSTARVAFQAKPAVVQIDPDDDKHYDFDGSDKYNFHSPTRNTAVSCTIVDRHGKVTAMAKKFSRTQFLAENGLHPRDLRSISHAKVSIIPSIQVRKNCILINMLEIQAVIRHDSVLILDDISQADIARMSVFIYDLENKLRTSVNHIDSGFNTTQAYEMKALESILMNTVMGLDVELRGHLSVLNDIISRLEDDVNRELLQELLVKSRALSHAYKKTVLVRDVMSELLDNDEDLVEMYLTEKAEGKERDLNDHAEVELLLEAYYKQFDELVQQSEKTIRNVRTTEEIINIMLDANRNSLMLMDLKITIGTLGFTVGMFFSALYGMNLENFIEESPLGFVAVSIAICVITTALTMFNFKRLSSVQKMTMMGIEPRPHPIKPKGRFSIASKSSTASAHRYDANRRAVMWKWLVDKGK